MCQNVKWSTFMMKKYNISKKIKTVQVIQDWTMLGFKPNPLTTQALNIHSYDYSYLKGNKSIKIKNKKTFILQFIHACTCITSHKELS